PTDPPRARDGEFLGGFQVTSDEDVMDTRSRFVGGPADSALEEAVIIELREDSATAHLDIRVTSIDGVIYLRGIVDDIEDAENAEAVAARVPGVVEVRDELEVRAGGISRPRWDDETERG